MKKVLLILIPLIFIWAFFIEPNILITKEYRVLIPELSGTYARIVFASDFHLKKNQEKRFTEIINKINSQAPDIVILGGDFVIGDRPEKSMTPEQIADGLSKLKAPMGVYAVLGNHDWWYDGRSITKALKDKNIYVLENENKEINIEGKTIYIAGVEDIMTREPNLDKAFNKTKNPVILVSHSPDIFADNPYKPILTLSGHTHGGQIRIPSIGALAVPSKYGNRYSQGLIEENSRKMIVTKGIGTSILPLRFNCLPEIVVVDISGNTSYEEKHTYQYRFSLLEKFFQKRNTPKKNKIIENFKITREISKDNPEAENIFWQKLKTHLDVSGLSDEEIFEKAAMPRYNQIFTYDLDDDSQDEIIGINKSQMCWGHLNNMMLILKRKGNDYEIIGDIIVGVEYDEIKILKHKTNGFHDIKLSNTEHDIPEKTLAFY